MLLPKNWWNSAMGLVNLHLKEVYWTSTWEKLSKSIQRRNIAKLEWKSVDVPSGTNHLHRFLEKRLFSLIILGFKKNGMLWAPYQLAMAFRQPSASTNQAAKAFFLATERHGMAFPLAILNQLIKGLQLFITSSMQHLPKLRWEHSLVCVCVQNTHTI